MHIYTYIYIYTHIYMYICIYIFIYIYLYIYIYICIYIYILYIYTHIYTCNPLTEHILIFIWFMLWIQRNLIYCFEAPGTAYKRLKKLTSFNSTTLNNKRIQKVLGSWMLRILSLFDFQKLDCTKALEALTQCLYGCIRYWGVWVKQFSISDNVSNHNFKKLLNSWMFMESFSFIRVCIIDGFDMN